MKYKITKFDCIESRRKEQKMVDLVSFASKIERLVKW